MDLFIFARFHARPGQEGAAAEALLEVLAPTREEPGCRSIHAFRSGRDPLTRTAVQPSSRAMIRISAATTAGSKSGRLSCSPGRNPVS